jgi:AcrR family transcriptional regulator
MARGQPRNTQAFVAVNRSPAKLPMDERILQTADRLFYQRGIRAIAVDTIAAEAGISKRTLYDHSPSKDDLIVAYLKRRSRPIVSSEAPAAEQILGVFDRLERGFARHGFRGWSHCPAEK